MAADFVEQIGEEPGQSAKDIANESAVGWVMLSAVVINEIMEAFSGYSFGKLILGVRIGTADGRKDSMGFYLLRYVVRNFHVWVWIGSGLTSKFIENKMLMFSMSCLQVFAVAALVLGSLLATDPGRQTLCDAIAGAAVYKSSDLT